MSTSVLASVCPAGSVGVWVQFSPLLEPQTAAEPSAALLSSQNRPLFVIASRGSENPLEFGTRTVVNGEPPPAPVDAPNPRNTKVKPNSRRSRRRIQRYLCAKPADLKP